MLKGESRGEPKTRPFGRPCKQGIFKKSSSPVQTATRKVLYTNVYGTFFI